MNDYDYDFKWDERYCYPNSNVLINKLGIMDEKKLHDAEREITSLRIASAKFHPIPGDFNLDHLRAIHQYIFGFSMNGLVNFAVWILQKAMYFVMLNTSSKMLNACFISCIKKIV